MKISNEEQEYVAYIVELMQSIGPVISKRMFGGSGLFLDGLMFALIADGLLYLKADKESESEFIEIELEKFCYLKKGKECFLSYYLAPEDALESADEMNLWANKAYSAALRAASKKRKKQA